MTQLALGKINFVILLHLFILVGLAPIQKVEPLSSTGSSITHQFTLGGGLAAINHNDQLQPGKTVNLNLHKVYLRQSEPSSSPWCYALTVNPIINEDDNKVTEQADKIQYNFLASQVWPSARVAASICEKYITSNNVDWKRVCELGCGPALPSLTIAKKGIIPNVIATDIDELALQMCCKAAIDQQIITTAAAKATTTTTSNVRIPSFTTKKVDLLGDVNVINEINADLYIISDVFESKHVAIGTAKIVFQALVECGSRVWVFSQSDRGLRDVFKSELEQLLSSSSHDDNGASLEWKTLDQTDMDAKMHKNCISDRLMLLDFDETHVNYG